MSGFTRLAALLAAVALVTFVLALTPAPAAAFNPVKPLCGVAGLVSGLLGKACGVIQNSGKIISAGKKLLSGHLGSAVKALAGGGASKVGAAVGLTAVVTWVLGGAKAALVGTADLIGHSTSPQLRSTWFSSTYWRMTELAAVLTLPFLFAAAVQAIFASDLAMLLRATLGYLPLGLLAVSIAAPLTMLLLSASDELSSIVSAAAGGDGARSLFKAGFVIGALSTFKGSAFLAFLLGLFIALGAFFLWLELLIREAAVYVVVLMLPLAFAALVWPARRIWAVRAVEALVALILAKFVIVAVLTLAAAGIGHQLFNGPSSMLAGLALVVLATFAPWALLRLLPMAEVASSVAGSLRGEVSRVPLPGKTARAAARRLGEPPDTEIEEDQPDSESHAREAAHNEKERLGDMRPVAMHRPNGHATRPEGSELSRDGESVPAHAVASVPEPGSEHTNTGRADMDDADAAIPATDPGIRAAEADANSRIPGMAARWQAPDGSWPVMILGPELFEADGHDLIGETSEDAAADDGPSDDPDPRPPAQPSGEGTL